jgi:hypothetical protein
VPIPSRLVLWEEAPCGKQGTRLLHAPAVEVVAGSVAGAGVDPKLVGDGTAKAANSKKVSGIST